MTEDVVGRFMAHRDPRTIRPDPRSLWQCPCGFEADFFLMRGHRIGWRKRPECRGHPKKIWDPTSEEPQSTSAIASSEPPKPSQPPKPSDQQAPSKTQAELVEQLPREQPEPPQGGPLAADVPLPRGVYEYLGGDDIFAVIDTAQVVEDDPEAQAARLLQEQALGPSPPPRLGGDGDNPLDNIPLKGDYRVETLLEPPHITPVRQTLTVPPIIVMIYDWAKNQGWMQGDGTISAFATDVILDHFRNCWGKAMVIINREEVSIVDDRAK